MEPKYRCNFTAEDFSNNTAGSIFRQMIERSNGGVKVRSMAAPALSTEFVRSSHSKRVTAESEGAFAEIVYPSYQDVAVRYVKKHDEDNIFGYTQCEVSDSYPAGVGERSAHALVREENVYQLKGIFPTAAMNYAKLRARVESRAGDVLAIDRIFAKMWGLSLDSVLALPRLHVEGSEATRLSAMEDRAYHALSGHPGHHGGYRVDTATIAPDALGESVPLNWQRFRTGLKAIATIQNQGDLEIAQLLHTVRGQRTFSFTMGLVVGSQPVYHRPMQWELIIDRMFAYKGDEIDPAWEGAIRRDAGYGMMSTWQDSHLTKLAEDMTCNLVEDVAKIAAVVSTLSLVSLKRTIEVLVRFGDERMMLDTYREVEFENLQQGELVTQFTIPRYKLTRHAMQLGIKQTHATGPSLPDMAAMEPRKMLLDYAEFREAKMMTSMDIKEALRLSIFITCMNTSVQVAALKLMLLVVTPKEPIGKPAPVRLRRQELYDRPEVRELGGKLFGDVFTSNLELILKNMVPKRMRDSDLTRLEIWEHLSARCNVRRVCPTAGGWRDLIHVLRDAPEGWSLYYWVRVTIGKKHHNMMTGILAPMAAGTSLDFLTVMKRGVIARSRWWANLYAGKYQVISGAIKDDAEKQKRMKEQRDQGDPTLNPDTIEVTKRYVPPHMRRSEHLGTIYDADEILSRHESYTQEQYERMVEAQAKAKFFAQIEVFSSSNRIAVGLSDETLRNMLIEFYQARWFSLDIRIKRSQKQGKVFKLGHHEFPAHPWGELLLEFPATFQEVLILISNLNQAAWTVPPSILHEKLRYALQELWDDIENEIAKIVQYIHDVHDDLAQEQEEVDAQSELHSVLRSMATVDAISLPAFGYNPVRVLPPKVTTVFKGGDQIDIPHAASRTEDVELEDEGEGLDDWGDEDEVITLDPTLLSKRPQMIVPKVEYLSLRAIWHALGYPETPDSEMKFVLGASSLLDLDAPHVAAEVGPILLTGEVDKVKNKWRSHHQLHQKRFGILDARPFDMDM